MLKNFMEVAVLAAYGGFFFKCYAYMLFIHKSVYDFYKYFRFS